MRLREPLRFTPVTMSTTRPAISSTTPSAIEPTRPPTLRPVRSRPTATRLALTEYEERVVVVRPVDGMVELAGRASVTVMV